MIQHNCCIIIFIDIYQAIVRYITCASFFNFAKEETWLSNNELR